MAELEIKPTVASRMRVTAVIMAGIGITLVLVFLLSGGGADSFAHKAVVTTYMPDVTGLSKDSEVRRNGIHIGKVTKIDITNSLDPQRAVRVDMKIIARFLKTVPADSQTSIGADTLIGFKFVDIAAGKSALLLADNGVLRSEPLVQADDRANLIRRFQTELRQADELLIQVASKDSKIGHYIFGDQEYNDLLKQVSFFERNLRSLAGAEEHDRASFVFGRFVPGIQGTIAAGGQHAGRDPRGEGAGGRLFASDEQYNQIVQDLQRYRALLADANAGKGQLGALLQDEAAYEKIRAMLASTDAMLRSLQGGEGQVARLLKDPQLYESLNGSLRNLQLLMEDLRLHPQKYLRYKVF